MARRRGLLVVIEGVDAVGKRTQTSILKSRLQKMGLSTAALSFPVYETAIGNEIRKFLVGKASYPPQVRAMLYAANRWESKAELEGILSRADVVIIDRYSGSNLAYGISNGLDLDWLMNLESGLPEPDLTLLLDASPADLAARRGAKDSYERNMDLQAKARSAYAMLAARFGWTIIDASRGVEATAKSITGAVSGALRSRGRTI
jgi:dTMP kinase